MSADVALHGFAYLGVLLTFVGVLGFLLFAFADIENDAQPFVELFIALVFFGWAGVLRRQQAVNVAKALELLGGAVLPLILFAGLVDGAPFPPNFESGPLVAALAVTAVLVALGYLWHARRQPATTLRYLVVPLIWLAVLAVGFIFKTDEALLGDAITRPVAAQAALASVAIALTLVPRIRTRLEDARLPVVAPALVAAPFVYVLALALSVGSSRVMSLSATVAGVASIVSLRQLGTHRGWGRRSLLAMPVVLAGAVVPTVSSVGSAWAGAIGAIAFIGLLEWLAHSAADDREVWILSAAGIVIGLGLTLGDPLAAAVAFGSTSLWINWRRVVGVPLEDEDAEGLSVAAAALAPVGFGWALWQLVDPGTAAVAMAGVVAVVAGAARLRDTEDEFWIWWPQGAGLAVAVAGIGFIGLDPVDSLSAQGTLTLVALGLVSLAIALGRLRPPLRIVGIVTVAALGVVPYLRVGWTGVLLVAGMVVAVEWQLRLQGNDQLTWSLAALGLGAGFVMVFFEPWAAVAGFGIASVWAHGRRMVVGPLVAGDELMVLAAGVVPFGLGWGLWQVFDAATAAIVAGVVLLFAAVMLRLRRVEDAFSWRWGAGTSLIVVALSIAAAGGLGRFGSVSWVEAASTITIGLSVSTVALGRRDVELRSFVVVVLVSTAVAPYAGPAWAGLVGVALGVAFIEWIARRGDPRPFALVLLTVAIATGLGLALLEPWAAIVAFGLASLWIHWRRVAGVPIPRVEVPVTVAAAALPFGLGWGLWQVIDGSWATLFLISLLTIISAAVRLSRSDDVFWQWWLPVTSTVVVALSVVSVGGLGLFGSVSWAEAASTVTIGLAALNVGLARGPVDVRAFVVLVLVGIGVVSYVDVGWTGLVEVVGSIIVIEWAVRFRDRTGLSAWLPLTLAAVGGALTFFEPAAAVVGLALASAWTHWRRITGLAIPFGDELVALAASVTPVGLAVALWRVMEGPAALLLVAALLVMIALAVRVSRSPDLFWRWWPSAAAVTVGGLAVNLTGFAPVAEPSSETTSGIVALVLVAATVALGPRNGVARTWAAAAVLLVDLHVWLGSMDAMATPRAVAWSAVGLVAVATGLARRETDFDHPPSIGHIVGGGAVIFAVGQDAQVVAVGAWTLGLVAAVTAQRLGRGCLPRLLARVTERFGARASGMTAWLVPVLLAVSVPLAVIRSLNLWDTFVAHRSWTGLAAGGVAVLFSIAVRLLDLDVPLRRSLTIAGSLLVVIGVAVAAPVVWPTIAAIAMSIVVALLLAGSVRGSALKWFAWTMSGVMLTLLGERAGLDDRGLRLLVLAVAVVYFAGGLVVDDLSAGRRARGEGLRVSWTRFPVLLGAVAVPASLGVLMALEPEAAPWSSLAAAGGYLGVAYLLRSPLVTVPAYALATFGILSLAPVTPIDEPLLVPGAVAGLLTISLTLRMLRGPASSAWDAWDLPPFLVAHAAAALALILATPAAEPLPWLLVGLMSGFVGVWRGSRHWIDGGHVLVLVGAAMVGTGAIAAALALTSVRAMYETRQLDGPARLAGHALATGAATASWVVTIAWARWTVDAATSSSGLVFGSVALLSAILHHHRAVRRDTAIYWLSTAALGVGYSMVAALVTAPAGGPQLLVVGPPLGLVMLAAALHIARASIEQIPSYASAVTGGAAWVTLLIFSAWDPVIGILATAGLGGGIVIISAEWVRRHEEQPMDVAFSWGVLGMAFVTGAIIGGLGTEAREVWTLGLAPATALTSLAAARASGAVRLRILRDAALHGVLGAVAMLTYGLRADHVFFIAAVLVLSVVASAVLVAMAGRYRRSGLWVGPLALFVVVASLVATIAAVMRLPDGAPMTAVLLVLGVQAAVVGLAWRQWVALALAPPALGIASVLVIAESAVGVVLWYTLPLAIVLLAEIEIVRTLPVGRTEGEPAPNTMWLEWLAIVLGVLPAVVDTFVRTLSSSFIAFGFAAGLLLWAVVTRLRRRAVAAAAVGAASAVLVIAAALAGSAPESSGFWIVAVGLGFAVMSVAGVIEAARSRRGFLVRRIDELMGDWQ